MKQLNKIAIIGSGISGLTSAHLLSKKYSVTVYEANHYIGGHTNTIDVKADDGDFSIDTGFIVFNQKTYPNFNKLLNILNVEKQKCDMSFGVSSTILALEYNLTTLNGAFTQRKNLLNPKFYRLLRDIHSFNKAARHYCKNSARHLTVAQFNHANKYGKYFIEGYLNPMTSAIWSTLSNQINDMPTHFIFDFYANHGLLSIRNRPQWYVIKGGSNQYVKEIIKPFSNHIRLNEKVLNISRSRDSVVIQTQHDSDRYDAVVIACHSDQALDLLEQPTDAERIILQKIPYIKNKALLHTDKNALPQNKRAWASWNYIHRLNQDPSLTYYMNKLQSLNSSTHYCVSINNPHINPETILGSFEYSHPLYNQSAIEAKAKHAQINNQNRTFFVGAYWGNGFHESGVQSSLNALTSLGVYL